MLKQFLICPECLSLNDCIHHMETKSHCIYWDVAGLFPQCETCSAKFLCITGTFRDVFPELHADKLTKAIREWQDSQVV
jgi:hypothetical protein